MHIIKHRRCSFSPHFIVSAVTEQANGDDDVSFKGQSFLSFQILLLEFSTAAEGYYFVFADHGNVIIYISR